MNTMKCDGCGKFCIPVKFELRHRHVILDMFEEPDEVVFCKKCVELEKKGEEGKWL